MRRFLAIAALLAAGLVGPTIPAGAAAGPPGTPQTITLVTGDQVLLGGPGGATVQPAKGRNAVSFLTQKDVRGDIHVTPRDALGLLHSGQLDPRLFNVTQLLAHGYGDDARTDIPLIVTHSAGITGARAVQELPSVNGTAVVVAKGSTFWGARSAGMSRIWLDGPVSATLDKSVPQIGAPAAWQAGYTGKNTTVAVLDTGIDATHPDLVDAVADARDFTNSASGTTDKFGHGTHVASIVTGKNDVYNGVAPDTKLFIGKVLNDRGSGTESQVIAGMQWAAASGAQVVNMSLGSELPSDGTDVVSQAVNTLTAQSGALFVIAAGNNGSTPGSPAAADAALTVGAVDSADALAPFSSRGPRYGDNAIKPDITAPGVGIVAAKAKGSVLAANYPNIGEYHLRLSGTSMATPHVAGAAAILAGEHPSWRAADLKAALMNSAKPNPGLSVFEQGAGRVDVAKAVTSPVHATPASISGGVALWPHNDDKPISTAVTYQNSSATPVTLSLAADVRDPAGKPAPTGMFTVSPSTLTIPAGGQAQATVVTDTTVNAEDVTYSGVITAGDVRTPIAITREPESYDVKLNFVDRNGNPTPDYAYRLVSISKAKSYQPYDASGSVSVRLPKGHYYFESQLYSSDGPLSVVIEPDLDMSGVTTVTADAREGKPVGVTLERPSAQPGETSVEFSRSTAWGGVDALSTAISGPFSDTVVRPSQTSAPGQFRYSAGGRFAEPDGKGSFSTSTYLYNVRADVDGRTPANPVLQVRDRDLVRIRSTHAATRPGTYGDREGMILKPLPYTLDELYSPNTPWNSTFTELDGPDQYSARIFTSTARSFSHSGTESWNQGVFGPVFPVNPGRPWRYASRSGDTMIFQVPIFSDSGANREGFSLNTGSTALYRDGVQLGTSNGAGGGLYDVPPGPGTYTLHSESTRDRALTSKISVDWTFRSDTVKADLPQALPLMSIRFTPWLDSTNQTPRVLPTIVPVSVEHNTRAEARPTTIQVSHDKGATWQVAPLVRLDGKWYTVLTHPKGAKSVSLQATAQDAAGNSVSQTIIDAFLLKG